MNCRNCGTMLSPTHKFCLNCGTPVENNNEVVVNNSIEQPHSEQAVTPETQLEPTMSIFETAVSPAPIIDDNVQLEPTPVIEPTPVVEMPAQEEGVVQPQVMEPIVVDTPVVEPPTIEMQVTEEPVVETSTIENTTQGEVIAEPLSGSNPVVPDTLVQPEVQPVIPTAPVMSADVEVSKVETPIAEIGNKELPVSVPMPEVTKSVVEPPKTVAEPVEPAVTKTPSEPEPKGEGKVIYAIIGFLIVVVICGTILFLALREPEEESSTSANNNKPQQEETVPMNNFKMGKFTYHIPARYTINIEGKFINVSNSNYVMVFQALTGGDFTKWSDLDGQAVVAEQGYTVIRSETKTYNGKKYLIVRALVNKVDGLFIFSKSTINYGVIGYGFATNYVYDDNLEKEIIDIMEKVEYNESANIDTNPELEIFDIIEKKVSSAN